VEGTIIKSTGSNYSVLVSNQIIGCRIKGSFRIKGIDATNPVVVGDRVEIEMNSRNDMAWIVHIHPRKNYIIRQATKLSKPVQIIASNLDFALVIATPVLPQTSTGFIDRFLATAEAYSIPAGIIFNKSDLYDNEIKEYVTGLSQMYREIGYSCFVVSALNSSSLFDLRNALEKKVTLFAGHSGAGKSTLINSIVPGLDLKTSELSRTHHKGMHTTTFAEMHKIEPSGFIIDTPGIREFGVMDFNAGEVYHFFPEMFRISRDCRFYNCTHIHENNCAVLKALDEGKISSSRYASYVSIFRNEDSFK